MMDLSHVKNSKLEPQYHKYKGRNVLRGDIVKADSGSYAVFTEQGSSASQMKAAKVMDIISRLPGCAGQAADAVSADTQVKMEDAPTLVKIPKSECPDIWIRPPKHKRPKSWSSMEDQLFLLSEICTVIFWQDYDGSGNLSKFYQNTFGKKDYSYQCLWTTSTWLEKIRTLVRHGKFSWKTLIWENQQHPSTMFIWVALKENVR